MASAPRLIATTPQGAVRLLGTGGTRAVSSFPQIRQYLRASLGEDYAGLLAEPRLDNANGTIDWFASVDAEPIPLPALPPEQRATAEAQLAERRARILQVADELSAREQTSARLLGELLRQAMTLADEDSARLAGDRLVLVNWGCSSDRAAGPPKAPLMAPKAQAAPSPLPAAATAAATTTAAAAPAALATGRPFWWWPLLLLLWLLFAGLMAANYYLLLEACAVSRPGPEDDGNPLLSFCPQRAEPATPPPELAEEKARADELLAKLRELELKLAEARRACPAASLRGETPAETEPPAESEAPEKSPVEVPPETETPPAETPEDGSLPPDNFDERLAEHGGPGGQVQVTLIWDGPADLDLIVICPDGQAIYYEKRSGCGGGRLDVDANYEQRMPNPVENVSWSESAPAGNYRVLVRNVDDPKSVPYRVRVTVDGESTEYSGSVAAAQSAVGVATFSVP